MSATTKRVAITTAGAEALSPKGRGDVAANQVISRGQLLATNASGYVVQFTESATLKSAGLADFDVDTTGMSNGALAIGLIQQVVDLDIGTAGDALVNADGPCAVYGIDNHTVGKTSNSGARSIAGVFLRINEDTGKARVWVGPVGYMVAKAMVTASAAEPAATLVSGTATLVAGTVTVANAAVTAQSVILVSRKSKGASTAIGVLATPTRTAATSFVIVAQKTADGTTETNDVSTVDYLIVG